MKESRLTDYTAFAEEDVVLMAQEGDEAASEYIISKYRTLAKTKSHIYFIAGGDPDDVIQEGMIGIFKAIRDFDPGRDAGFRTFAELCINRQIVTAIKAANRQKYKILNESVSIDYREPGSDGDDAGSLSESMKSGEDTNPESMTLMREVVSYLKANGENIFSPMENLVWNETLKGKTYMEIAREYGKTPKAVDNALQRVKKKVMAYLEI
ncbi:MAG TPA: sigma-70 family RNA polymerase sigma factor [Candidatus Avanaerovorax faecigallinarum]|nr:sigma-70 family RNA polymerase sigma factor [Candidatus Avanaerovorax faecigallinarum]